jgi:hypothetical protein
MQRPLIHETHERHEKITSCINAAIHPLKVEIIEPPLLGYFASVHLAAKACLPQFRAFRVFRGQAAFIK